MEELPKYYTALFNAITDAITALERQDYGTAHALLIQGQQAAEDVFTGKSVAD